MPLSIVDLANSILNNPEHVSITPETTTAETVEQSLYHVSKDNKRNLLLQLLDDESISTALVFTRTKYGADKLARLLNKKGIKTEALHSNKSQMARQKALKNFKNQYTKVLVATDIAARGIDVDDLSCVINFEIPNIAETYVHRIGRTGRAGAAGRAISLCDTDELPYIRDIQKLISMKIDVVKEHPYHLESSSSDFKQETNKPRNNNQRKKSPYRGKRRYQSSKR
jgi:ATP-dependent RNA helicase RhlE